MDSDIQARRIRRANATDAIQSIADGEGVRTVVWHSAKMARTYVAVSRGRQEIGIVQIHDSGAVTHGADLNPSLIRRMVAAARAAME